jgi:CubicO group peptidase (beta-lactamase class C family)
MNTKFLNNLDSYLKMKHYRLVNAVLVYENGELVFERYYNKAGKDSRNHIKSVWKSILSLTLGICLDKGIIKDIDEPVKNYLPQFAKEIHLYHKLISIRHLLTMSSGIYWNGGIHYHCPMLEQMKRWRDWAAHIADVQMADFPGTKFVYKEWDVILLSALIGAACGSSAWDICYEYLYQPLGIKSERWTRSKCGVDYPCWGEDASSDLSARDMAKIGLLMSGGGLWNGKRIISQEYIKTAVSPSQSYNGYGCLFWLSDKSYHGRGFGGQELNIYPGKKIVAVVQATVTPSSKSYGDICENILAS